MSVFLSTFLRIVFAFVYTAGFLLAALFTAGAGEGTFILVVGVFTWPLVLVSIFLISWADRLEVRSWFVILMFVHYAVSFLWGSSVEYSDQFYSSSKYIRQNPGFFAICVLWYIAGQVIIWLIFGKQVANAERNRIP